MKLKDGIKVTTSTYKGSETRLLRSDGGTTLFDSASAVQSGTPNYVWGWKSTDNEYSYYKYNPANFSVNYATTAGSATNDGSGNSITLTYVKKAGDTMTGNLIISKSNPILRLKSTNDSGDNTLQFYASDNTYRGKITYYGNIPTSSNAYAGYLEINSYRGNAPIKLTAKTFYFEGGNVGIATNSPVTKLHVQGTIRTSSTTNITISETTSSVTKYLQVYTSIPTSSTSTSYTTYACYDTDASYHKFNKGILLTTDWFRSTGTAGWYSQTYGGGWYMKDSTYIRTFNNKALLVGNTIRNEGYVILGSNTTSTTYYTQFKIATDTSSDIQASNVYSYFETNSSKFYFNKNIVTSGTLTATQFIVSGGISSQFLKADGSLDSNTYLTSHQSLSNYVTLNSTQTISGAKTFSSQIVSTYTSAAPFSVQSSTLVSKLNADLLDGYHAAIFLPTAIPYTGSDKVGYWVKIATITLTSRYSSKTSLLAISDEYTTSLNKPRYSLLYIKVQQQAAFGSAPNITLSCSGSIDKSYFVALLTTSSTSSVVDIYFKEDLVYERGWVSRITGEYIINVGSLVAEIPSGTQYACSYGMIANYATSAGSATSTTEVIVNYNVSSDVNYPLIWTNQTGSSTTTDNQLYKSANTHLVYNPSTKKLYNSGVIQTNSKLYTGTIPTDSSASNSTTIDKGFIELYLSTPYIDFHYDNSTANYTSRIMERQSGVLTISGKLNVGVNDNTDTNSGYQMQVAGATLIKSSIKATSFINTSYNSSNYVLLANGDVKAISDFSTITAGASESTSKLYLIGATQQTSTAVQTYTGPSTPSLQVYMQNGIMYASAYFQNSDKRLKKNIVEISQETLDKVANIELKAYQYKVTKRQHYGVIAQELEDFGLNELVQNSDEYKTVDYISLLVLKIRYLEKEIKKLKKDGNIISNTQ